MPDSPPIAMPFSREPLEMYRLLYPIFKREVFRRRETMIQLSAFHHTILLVLLVMFPLVPSHQAMVSTTRWFAITGIALFSGFFAYAILQQAHRHRLAKQQLIVLEKAMGLYNKGCGLSEQAAYPEHWQTDWKSDRSLLIYLTLLASLASLTICAILMRP
jgi:hypothetical protein